MRCRFRVREYIQRRTALSLRERVRVRGRKRLCRIPFAIGASAVGNSLPSPCTSESCVISLIDFAPVSVIATFISFSIRFSRLATPACARCCQRIQESTTQQYGVGTERNHTHDIKPVRIPLSARMAISPFTASAIAGNARAEESTPSSWRPPWLETTIPSAPKRTASRAYSDRGSLSSPSGHSLEIADPLKVFP